MAAFNFMVLQIFLFCFVVGQQTLTPVTLKAVVNIQGQVQGRLTLEQTNDGYTTIRGELTGLAEGKHGFHIHQLGDLSNNCKAAGGHYNPYQKEHGAPTDTDRHVGDLGNIYTNSYGLASVTIFDTEVHLSGPYSVIGRAFVVHAGVDDLGKGGDDESKKTGNAGARVGCGVIGIIL